MHDAAEQSTRRAALAGAAIFDNLVEIAFDKAFSLWRTSRHSFTFFS
jgi:hypothetical protein